MKKTALALTGALVLLIGAVAPAAVAQSGAAKGTFKTTATPNKHVKPGTTITVKGHGAEKSTAFFCAALVINKKHTGRRVVGNVTNVTSTSSGAIKCKQKFQPILGTYGGKKYSCPTTKSNRKAGWTCAIGLADVATQGKKSGSLVTFTAKK